MAETVHACKGPDVGKSRIVPLAETVHASKGPDVGPSRIVPLPEEVAGKIRGSVWTPSFGSILSQLIYNALDAEATQISIKIDVRNFGLQIRDNGNGMTLVDLHRCGCKSFTSKLQDQSQLMGRRFPTFGFKGEALSSMSEFCHLEIETRSRSSPSDSGRKVLGGNKTVCTPRHDGPHCFGTTVTCRDLFFNRPVIRKMMASSERWENSSSTTATMGSSTSVIERLLCLVRAISVAHPGTSFAVYETSRFQPLLTVTKASTHLAAFSRLFKSVRADALFELEETMGRIRICALLCSPDAPGLPRNKEPQLVFVNGRPAASSPAHKHLNAAFKAHWDKFPPPDDAQLPMGVGEGGVIGGSIAFPQRKRRRAADGATSVAAPTRRYPCFLVQIQCPPAECCFHELDESCTVELACWDLVLEAIDALTADFFAARKAEAPAPPKPPLGTPDATAAPDASSADASKRDSEGVKGGGAAGGRSVVVPFVPAQLGSYGALVDMEPPNSPWSLGTKGGGGSSAAEQPAAAAPGARFGRATAAAAGKAGVAGKGGESAPDEHGAAAGDQRLGGDPT
ncbi:histidine kinase-like ATPase [Baffinella frigidus]|nr:histidine kinase-like ATPase [Cryptophyta sp. CCMP2293]